ncbi:Plasma membrane permease, mediates uptake of glycerophosphoinositol and glycerophosphocholine [Entophlyctis luteolus]|nr:Plasma membrane permease, mediates uptake of glycerophosphoinositol and glycerophosphocholine [Entophlyctis luteolus]KAJ3351495.1 Plasma membrane permease, mediates uptake of glycerophosphoinositol and glycerophosphocholine [Entophlyctis luteolus]KAJ3390465.1 Plasma membrane permease, mediates uptake of glycerophosphoinositol and glycerophosphocholine [Entophlyctis sp. JEL0112]
MATKVSGTQRTTNWFTVIFAGIALLSDGYQNNVFNLINVIFGKIYSSTDYTSAVTSQVQNWYLVGTIIGQLGLGLIIDRLGRKTGLLITTICIILGTLLSAACSPSNNPYAFFWMLSVVRGLTGIGVGGEYPASSASASEAAEETAKTRGTVFVLVTNLVLSAGGPLGIAVLLILLSAFGTGNLEGVWRTAFGLGALLPLSVFYFRLKMGNSERFKKTAITRKVPYWLAFRRYWKSLLGVAGCWFIYDFVVFPNGTFSGAIINNLVKDTTVNGLLPTFEWQLLLGLFSIPGILLGAVTVEKIGRKWTMTIGFVLAGTFGLLIGGLYSTLQSNIGAFIVLYGLFLSSANFGPGDCLGLTAAESFPTPIRGVLYGLCAAIGKAGAAVGTAVLVPLRSSYATTAQGNQVIFYLCGALGFLGAIWCFVFVTEFSKISFDNEDAAWLQYLADNGWHGDVGFEKEMTTPETVAEVGTAETKVDEV